MIRKIYRVFQNILFQVRRIKIRFLYFIHYNDMKGIMLSPGIRIESNVDFFFRKHGNLIVKGNTLICKQSKIVINGGDLHIEDGCTFGANNIFNVFSDINIGKNVLTADRVSFITNIHEYRDITSPISWQAGGGETYPNW